MDPSSHTNFYHHGYQILSSIKTHQQQSIYKTPSHSPDTSSPILVIALLGIMTTAFLLVGYYVFVIKCWLNFHQIDVVRRFSFIQARRTEDPLMGYDSARPSHGVDESVIRTIPIVQFKGEGLEISYLECAVCLNEFQEEEKLRVLPSCTHAFHIDCIDIWLQNNANCPLCRSSISTTTTTTTRFPLDQIIAPTSSPQDQTPFTETVISSDENFVVIEIRGDEDSDQTSSRRRETEKSGDIPVQSINNHSPRKLEQRTTMNNKKGRKFHHVSSMGDECIDIRGKDDQFKVQPIRRSISMDSSADRQLYLAVQEIIQQKQNRHFSEVSTSEGCSGSKVRRSFFSFGHSRGSSRSAVLPIQFE